MTTASFTQCLTGQSVVMTHKILAVRSCSLFIHVSIRLGLKGSPGYVVKCDSPARDVKHDVPKL